MSLNKCFKKHKIPQALQDAVHSAIKEVNDQFAGKPANKAEALERTRDGITNLLEAAREEHADIADQVHTTARANRAQQPYTKDLFGDAVTWYSPTRSDNTGVSGDVQPTHKLQRDDVTGVFATRTKLVTEGKRTLGAAVVKTPQDAAQAMAYLARGAVERFDVLITDKKGKPLAVVGSFKGTLAETAVYPSTVAGEAFRIKGAANAWFAHNHPSGLPDLSSADRRLAQTLIEVFRGSEIEPRGIFAIGGGVDAHREWTFWDGQHDSSGTTEAPTKTASVPTLERVYDEHGRIGDAITSPDDAKAQIARIANGESGIVLTDSQNRPNAFVPIAPEDTMPLRGEGRMDALYRALSMANARSGFVVNHGVYSERQIQNLTGFLKSIDTRPLDVMDVQPDGSVHSWVERGIPFESSTSFFSRKRLSPEDKEGLAEAHRRVATQADLFEYPKSSQKTLEGIVRDILPNAKLRNLDNWTDEGDHHIWELTLPVPKPYRVMDEAPDSVPGTVLARFDTRVEAQQYMIDHPKEQTSLSYEPPSNTYISQKNGGLEINAIGMGEGRRGAAVYAAVGNYAHNNGLIFYGDSKGITQAGKRRRLENMTSLALKFGNTDFIQPHPDMVHDWPEASLMWDSGKDNLPNLLSASYNVVSDLAPEIRNAHYDFSDGKFYHDDGREFTRDDFDAIAKRLHSGIYGEGTPGTRTMQSAVLSHTLLQRAGREGWGRVLASLGVGGSENVWSGLKETRYSAKRDATLSWEATPSVTAGDLPGIHDAPVEQQVEYSKAIRKALSDEHGNDLIAQKLGLNVNGATEGFSGWEGKTNPGVQSRVGITTKDGRVSAASRELINLDSDIRGLALHQDGVAWHLPIYNGAKYGQNGVEFDIGRKLTAAESDDLYRALAKELGHTYSPPIPTDTGFRVLNFPDEKFALMDETDKARIKELQLASRRKNNDFYAAVKQAVARMPFFDEVGNHERFETDGELRSNDWATSRNGEDYRERIAAADRASGRDGANSGAGQPDLLKWIDDYLRPRVEAVNRDFAAKYGWDRRAEEVGTQYSPKREEESPIFYSQLARTFDAAPDKVFNQPAKQVSVWLQSNAAKLGVKKDEIQWTGITDWLDAQGKNKVTKQQVADFLDQGGVKVEEVVLGEETAQKRQVSMDEAKFLLENEGDKWEITNQYGGRIYPDRADMMSPDQTWFVRPVAEVARNTTWQLPGGENPVELALYVPSAKPWDTGDKTHYGDVGGGRVVVWVRGNTRTDSTGAKVFFIEEIQSKRAQKGREEGFSGESTNPYGIIQDNRDHKWYVKNYVTGVTEGLGHQTEAAAEKSAADRYRSIGVPTAPFVTDTKAWTALALKRMIRYAADNGFDKVAWTTGEQQAARYDLSKQLDAIGYERHGDTFSVTVWATNGKEIYQNKSATTSELEGVIGKELTKKISDGYHDSTGTTNGLKYIEGNGLKVGGEGMKGYYDQIVPQVANDILKKLGGGRVGPVDVSNGLRHVDPDTGLKVGNGIASKEQLGFDITPAMKENAQAGQPLFSPKRGDEMLSKTRDFTDSIIDDIQLKLTPMATGSDRARAAAKDAANAMRLAQWQWAKFDETLKDSYTSDQLKAMWEAADEEGVLRQQGKPTQGKGLDRLPADQRATVEALHKYGEDLLQRAREVGMFKGEGLPYWVPRIAVMIGADGEYYRPPSGVKGESGSAQGRNITTSSPNLKQRKYLTAEETEAAMQGKLGDEAQLVRDIRTMPLAMARLERAIAGRELINQIKEIGAKTGEQIVSTSEGPAFFTLDHPAFKTYRPHFIEQDGKMVPAVDQDGNMLFDRVPIYISKEFEGPIKAIMSDASGALYSGLMTLKGKSMSVIMYSPLIHNAVEWGRALPVSPGKVASLMLYFEGNRAKNDPEIMREAISAGLVPIGHRGGIQDITGVMEDPSLNVGRSWTAKLLAAPVGVVSKEGANAVKRGVDMAGDVWHNKLLWDRVGDLQMGLYLNVKAAEMKKGLDERSAALVAAHFANRYAGAIPNESMSVIARKLGNIILFSRSFTLGNLGVMKDVFTGLPRDVQAQIRLERGELALASAKSAARKKAIEAFMIDAALLYVGLSIMQNAFDYIKRDDTLDDILRGYADRFDRLLNTVHEDPLHLLKHPLGSVESLTPTGENEPGKQLRAHYGEDEHGTANYIANPVGKVGGEFTDWLNSPLDIFRRKLSQFVRPIVQTATNDRGFGRRVYDPELEGWDAWKTNAWRIVKNFMVQQVPANAIEGLWDWEEGVATDVDKMKVAGPMFGLQMSKGAPGGPEMGEIYHAEAAYRGRLADIREEVNHDIKLGDIDSAVDKLEAIGMPPNEISRLINSAENPETRLNKGALKRFNRHATEEEKDRLERMRSR